MRIFGAWEVISHWSQQVRELSEVFMTSRASPLLQMPKSTLRSCQCPGLSRFRGQRRQDGVVVSERSFVEALLSSDELPVVSEIEVSSACKQLWSGELLF